MAHDHFTYRLTGTTPSLMHNGRLANPLDPIARKMKQITAKGRKKTDEDFEALALLEWEGGFYLDERLGPHWPAQNIEAMIREAARATKKGRDVERGLQVIEAKVPLEYDGPRDLKGMQARLDRFLDTRRARPPGSGGTVMRTRPIFFTPWSVLFGVRVDLEKLNEEEVFRFLEYAGKYIGLSDYRPRYGLFTVERARGEGNGKG